MRIGIMGGTFNPIHNAHLLLGEIAREEYRIDTLLFMPDGNPPHKRDIYITPAVHRERMCCLATANNPDFTVCDYETQKTGFSYTSETLEYMTQTYPSDEIFFIIGSDSLFALETWHEPEKILNLCTLLVFCRGESRSDTQSEIDRLTEKYGARIFLIHAPLFDISSSQIRERIAHGKSVRYMVPDAVLEYIRENGLYMGEKK